MNRIRCLSLLLVLIAGMVTGCASTQQSPPLTSEVVAKIRTVAITDEISTPTSLTVPSAAGAGLLVAAVVDPKKQNAFTAQVSANIDFQKVAAEMLRESFALALKAHPGWVVVGPQATNKADAAFVLSVDRMGVARPRQFWPPPSHLDYTPIITLSATLIGCPPFEIVRENGKIQPLDAANHPVYYRGTQRVTDSDNVACHRSADYSGKPEVFKTAFRKAIDLAVKRIVDSMTAGPMR